MGSDAVLSRFSASSRPVRRPCAVLSGHEGHQPRVFIVGMCADVQHMPNHSQTADSVENFGQVSRRGVRLSQRAGPMCDRHAYPPENLRMAAPPNRFHPGGAESTTESTSATRRTAEAVEPYYRLTVSGAGNGALPARVSVRLRYARPADATCRPSVERVGNEED